MPKLYCYDDKYVYTHSVDFESVPETTPVAATTIEVPQHADTYVPVFNMLTNSWTLVQDLRGTKGYLNGHEYTHDELGALPIGFVSYEDHKLSKIKELESKLAEIDSKSIRTMRSSAIAVNESDLCTESKVHKDEMEYLKEQESLAEVIRKELNELHETK